MTAGALQRFGIAIFVRHVERLSANSSFGHKAAELAAALQQILGFTAVKRWAVEWGFDDFFIGQWNVEASAKFAQFTFIQLLLLMRNVAPFTCFTQAVAFDSLRQNNCRRPLVFDGTFVSRINLCGIMTAPEQFMDLLVGHVVDHFQKLWVFPKKMLPSIASRLDRVLLIIPVDRFFHAL